MNKKFLTSSLVKIANFLDENNYIKEAEEITNILVKLSQRSQYSPNQIVYMAFSKFFGPNFNADRTIKQKLLNMGLQIYDEASELAQLYNTDQNQVFDRLKQAYRNFGLNFETIFRSPSTLRKDVYTDLNEYLNANDVIAKALSKIFGSNVNNSYFMKKNLPKQIKKIWAESTMLGELHYVPEIDIERKLQEVYRKFGLDFYDYYYQRSIEI